MNNMSSTYRTHIVVVSSLYLTYIPLSDMHRLNPSSFKDLSACLFQACDACLRPYNALLRRTGTPYVLVLLREILLAAPCIFLFQFPI
jgi:hypothetical protein